MADSTLAGGAPPSTRHTLILADRAQIRLQRCKLIQLTGSHKGREFELTSGEVTVGTAADCDLPIDSPSVSQRHFVIYRDQHSYLVRDLDSTNGTYVDDARIREAYLRPGAVIHAGDIYFRFDPVYQNVELVPSEETHFGRLVGESLRMREIFAVLATVAPTEATVLLEGETGTGKGAVARALHEASPRRAGPFVVLDCGAIAPTLIESELFGHERGAFTGAVQQRRGALETASGGTLFIDELAALTLDLQPKLLRALEEREFSRIGGPRPLKVDCRIVASTQGDLWTRVTEGRFREDLYFRLAVVTIPLPPLREHKDDIPALADGFLGEQPGSLTGFDALRDGVRQQMLAHDWPGNVRELRNVVERMRLMPQVDPFSAPRPGAEPLPVAAAPDVPTIVPTIPVDCDLPFKDAKDALVATFERVYLQRLLERHPENLAAAARQADIDRKYLYRLLAKHGLGSGKD